MRPAGLSGPRAGVPDNLTRIRGVGERNEARLNRLGIYHFGQIAAWTPGEVRWIGQYLAFPERIERDDWVGQAMILASGGDTGFEKSADRRRRRRRERNQSVAAQQLAADVESIMGRRRSTPQSDADDANESDDD
jgi:nucleotidyltransferase/DNA polymerase involved in DNA repair